MKPTVAVIFGGKSVEHEVSIISGVQALLAIDTDRFTPVPIYIAKDGTWHTGEPLWKIASYKNIPAMLAQCTKIAVSPNPGENEIVLSAGGLFKKKTAVNVDVYFPVMHGTYGEDGCLQGFLELKNAPYVGCGVEASALGMNKALQKMVLESIGCPTLPDVHFNYSQWNGDQAGIVERIGRAFPFPVIAKAATLGSSIGIEHIMGPDELGDKIDAVFEVADSILVEPLLQNFREINCSVMGDEDGVVVSELEEPIRSQNVLSFEDKYIGGPSAGGAKGAKGAKASSGAKGAGGSGDKRIIPAPIDPDLASRIRTFASEGFTALGCSGLVRVDFLLAADGSVYWNEMNTIPGSLAFYLWEPVGISFTELTTRLIDIAVKRHRSRNRKAFSFDNNLLASFSGGKAAKGKG
jgi:D-alanine-D-alanine ligase